MCINMIISLIYLLFIVSQFIEAALSCRSCANVKNVSECVNNVTCGQHEICYTATTGHLKDRYLTLGCQSEQACQRQTMNAVLIGRRKRASTNNTCHQCCTVDGCNNFLCAHMDNFAVHAGWGEWQAWQACSVTQGTGLRRRQRNCDNPYPADGGHHCYGDVYDYGICSMHRPNVKFYIRDVHGLDVALGAKIVYKTTLWDTAGSYNTRTGVFTAPVAGLYTFTVTVCVVPLHEIGLQIKTTSGQGQLGELYHINYDNYTTSTMTGVGELQVGNQVWVQCIYATVSGNDLLDAPAIGRQNSFQGTLIHVS